MAWAGIIFFSVGCRELQIKRISLICSAEVTATLILILFAVLVLAYIKKQYELQGDAVDVNVGCLSLAAKIISGEKSLEPSDCKPAPDSFTQIKNHELFPKCLLEEIRDMPKQYKEDRRSLEELCYAFFGFITILALFLI